MSAWVRQSVRSLFPPLSWKRLRFRGGLLALPIYALLVLIYPLSLQQADWVRTSDHFTWLAILGIVLGILAGNSRMSTYRAVLLAGVLGAITIVISTAMATEGTILREKLITLAMNVNNWLTQVLAGEAATDPTVFIVFLGGTVWASAFAGTFALMRTGRPWDMLVFVGFCLVLNVSMALQNLLADLVAFTLGSLILLVRLNIVTLEDRWKRFNIVPSGEMDWRLLRGGLTWSLVLVIMAFFTPRVGAAEVLSNAYNVFESPYNNIQAEWQRFFAGVSGPSRLKGVSFADSIRLGLSPNLSDQVVMTIDATSGHFWRAITYDFYTGNGWRTTETDDVTRVAPPTLGRERFDATFHVQVPQGGSILFAANEPVHTSVQSQFQVGADRSYSTGIRAVHSGDASANYTVTSYVSVADKAVLRRAPTAYPEYIRQKYLQLPSTLPARVKTLAHDVAGAESNPYDQAEAIETYLRTNFKYSTNVRAAPAGRDPIDYFLFTAKEDFCEYFASSMVVMLREMGVPARLVEGFAPGQVDNNTGRYVIREADAHAWVEAYFPGYGWIEFEPTPSQSTPLRTDADATGSGSLPGGDTGDGSDSGVKDPTRQDSQGLGQQDLDPGVDNGAGDASVTQRFDPLPLIAVLLAMLAVVLAGILRFQLRFRRLAPIDAAWGKARLLASYAGYRADPAQTPYEYAAMLGEAVPDAKGAIREIADVQVRDRYTAGRATDEDVSRAASAWHRLARTLLSLVPARLVSFVARLFPQH